MKRSKFLTISLIILFGFAIITPSLVYANSYNNLQTTMFIMPMPPGGGSGDNTNKNPKEPSNESPEMANPILSNDGSQSQMVKQLSEKLSKMPKANLTQKEKMSIQTMMEYEKMVRDVYAMMYQQWQTKAFENMGKKASAEMAAMKLLLERYGINNPVTDPSKAGDFQNQSLQKTFEQMVENGNKSLIDAIKTCAELEEMNLMKIENALENANSDDLKTVYSTMLKETVDMLKSLVYMLSIEGVKYQPKYMPLMDFNKLMGIKETNKEKENKPSNQKKEKTQQEIQMIMRIGKKTMEINGKKIEFDAAPMIKHNRTLVPIRAIIEAMGGKISWDPNERKVTIILDNKTIELWINKAQAVVNGETVWIDPNNHEVVPIIVPPGRTMLPLRFILEELGATVNWNATTKTITITYIP